MAFPLLLSCRCTGLLNGKRVKSFVILGILINMLALGEACS